MSIIIQFLNDHFHFFVSSDSQIYCMNFLTSIRKHIFFLYYSLLFSVIPVYFFSIFFLIKSKAYLHLISRTSEYNVLYVTKLHYCGYIIVSYRLRILICHHWQSFRKFAELLFLYI